MAYKFKHMGVDCEVYKHGEEWRLKVGMTIYTGYRTKAAAKAAASRWLGREQD